MRTPRERNSRRWYFFLPLFLGIGFLAVSPTAERGQALQATEYQFWMTNNGPACGYCCFTGYCCSVPVEGCDDWET
jgi:hypothetical protein